MKEYINIDDYFDGYSISQVLCFQLITAGASGYYNRNNYFYYCFYYLVYRNWISGSLNSISLRNEILNKMGLCIKSHSIDDSSDLHMKIKHFIDNKLPVLMIVEQRTCFYLPRYHDKSLLKEHHILVVEYNTDSDTKTIKDVFLNTILVEKGITSGSPLSQLQLSNKLLSEIWDETCEIYKENKSPHHNVIYTIERISESKINSYNDLIADFLNNFKYEQSNFSRVLELFNGEKNITSIWDNCMRDFYNFIDVIFDIAEKTFSALKNGNVLQIKYQAFKNEYKNTRYSVMTILYKSVITGKKIQGEEIEKLKEVIESMDKRLFKLILEMFNESEKMKSIEASSALHGKLKNYALNTSVKADSEIYPASQAVNGKSLKDIEDAWISTEFNTFHWLKVDLKQEKIVKRFVVKHIGSLNYNTQDYKIQGSNGKGKWTDIIAVEGNTSNETVHEVKDCKYRYIRLYITKPGLVDRRARIYEFEVWG